MTKPQATVLALWTLGMGLARSCALTAVRVFLATWLRRKEQTGRQQLRECCYEAPAQRGRGRCALDVTTCFVPLLAWVVPLGQGTQLALALDATTLGSRLTVLARRVKKRMRLHARSISGAPRAVLDSKVSLYPRCSG